MYVEAKLQVYMDRSSAQRALVVELYARWHEGNPSWWSWGDRADLVQSMPSDGSPDHLQAERQDKLAAQRQHETEEAMVQLYSL